MLVHSPVQSQSARDAIVKHVAIVLGIRLEVSDGAISLIAPSKQQANRKRSFSALHSRSHGYCRGKRKPSRPRGGRELFIPRGQGRGHAEVPGVCIACRVVPSCAGGHCHLRHVRRTSHSCLTSARARDRERAQLLSKAGCAVRTAFFKWYTKKVERCSWRDGQLLRYQNNWLGITSHLLTQKDVRFTRSRIQ